GVRTGANIIMTGASLRSDNPAFGDGLSFRVAPSLAEILLLSKRLTYHRDSQTRQLAHRTRLSRTNSFLPKKSLQRKPRKGPETCQACSAPAIPSRRGEKCSRPTNTIGMLRVCRRSAPKIGESFDRNRTGAKLSSSVTADCTRSAPIVPQR